MVGQTRCSTHADVVADGVVGEVWSLAMGGVEIGFLFDRRGEGSVRKNDRTPAGHEHSHFQAGTCLARLRGWIVSSLRAH